MNFLAAILHAGIGYGIRRKSWNKDAVLYLDNLKVLRWLYGNAKDEEARLLGPEVSIDVTSEDVRAKDWETV